MIELRLRRRQGDFLLDLDVRCQGRVVGLFGASGSGKTTVLNCIAGISRVEQARIKIAETTLIDTANGVDSPARRRGIGYVFQDALLFEHMSVRANILYGFRRSASAPKFEEVVATLELADLLERSPRVLSGGEKRRVAIARALISGPALLLLDEPLSGLDAPLAGRILGYLARLLERYRIPALYVSHALSDVLFLCDEALIVAGGRITAQGLPRQVLLTQSSSREHLASLCNTFRVDSAAYDPTARTMRATIGGSVLIGYPSREGQRTPLTCSVRACDIILSASPPVGISARNIMSGAIREIRELADRHIVVVDAGPSWMVEVSRASVSEMGLNIAQPIHLIVKATAVAFH